MRQKFARSAAAKGAAAAASLDGVAARLGAEQRQRVRAKAARQRKQERLARRRPLGSGRGGRPAR